MLCRIAVLCLLVSFQRCFATDPPSKQQMAALFEEGENQRPERVKTAQTSLTNLKQELDDAMRGKKREKVGSGWHFKDDFRTPSERKATIDKLKKEVEESQTTVRVLQDTTVPILPYIQSLSVGQIGGVAYQAEVRQRIGKSEAVIVVTIDGTDENLVYWKGYDLSNLSDGSKFAVPGAVVVSGTKTYRTVVGGTKTVPLLEPIKLGAYFDEEKAKRKGARMRTWTSGATFKVTAMYISYADGKVTLRKEDDTDIVVPIAKLSKEDQDFIRKEVAASKKAAKD